MADTPQSCEIYHIVEYYLAKSNRAINKLRTVFVTGHFTHWRLVRPRTDGMAGLLACARLINLHAFTASETCCFHMQNYLLIYLIRGGGELYFVPLVDKFAVRHDDGF